MPEEQDDTILILGASEEPKETPPKPEVAALHTDDFRTVLEERCNDYVILTSVKALTYRVEVFESHELIDAIELACVDLAEGAKDRSVFLKRYSAAHEKFKHKFCKKAENKVFEKVEPRANIQAEQYQSSQQFIPKMHSAETKKSKSVGDVTFAGSFNGQWKRLQERLLSLKARLKENQGFKLTMVLLGVVLTVLVLGRFVICQLDYFLDNEEKVSYYKQTESFCHKLEEGCLGLAQSKMVDEDLFSPEQCQYYCNEGDISFESCETFIRHFKTIIVPKVVVPEQNTFVQDPVVEKVEEKVVFLQTEPFKLILGKTFALSVENIGRQACTVKVKNLTVTESEHDEIVQFSGGVSHLNIATEQTRKFKLFLEESYYRQFVKGKYTGEINFSLFYENGKKETQAKSFFFEVK